MSETQPVEVAEPIYEGGLVSGWQDWGWTPHELKGGGPARVRFDNWGGLILAKPGLSGTFGGVRFRMKSKLGGADILQVSLWSDANKMSPVQIGSADTKPLEDGWLEVFLPMNRLNPDGLAFDRVVVHAARELDADYILLDRIVLVQPTRELVDATVRVRSVASTVRVECAAKATRVSPYIFGFAYYPFNSESDQAAQWLLKGTIRRWGGNVTSTYNWEVGSWNIGSDWFFENQPASHQKFLDENAAHGTPAAVTVPIMGWVAKDAISSSFPVAIYGPQAAIDQGRPEAGNGRTKQGKDIKLKSPLQSYQASTPEHVKRWIQSIRNADATRGQRSVWMYILDNEPMLWSLTHRDAHPDPASYDELLNRTIAFGTAIREADPSAIIAGPAEWGWMGYMYSAKDLAQGGPSVRLDRRSHGDLPLVAYYLETLAKYEREHGIRILDVLDLHAYPYAEGVHSERADTKTADLRIRSTRMLWDSDYVDESWVNEPVRLLPRMQDWISKYYPGRGISIGEWNFGGESHISGAIAIAEVLGRYAQYGVTSAFYWTYPPANTPAMWAFRAFRDFDSRGSHFQEWFTKATIVGEKSSGVSAFVSRDESGKHLVAVLVNSLRDAEFTVRLDLDHCGDSQSVAAWAYKGKKAGFESLSTGRVTQLMPSYLLSPLSITVLDVDLANATPVVH